MKTLICCMLILLTATTTFGADPGGILGIWKTEKGESEVEIYKCGDKFCGKIIWLQNPIHIENEVVTAPVFDRKNPDPALQRRPVLGLRILEGFTAEGKNTWGKGTCYDPKSGKTYHGKIYLTSPDHLELRGYVGIPLFGRSSNWTR